ncbi:MAG: flavodoxin-dependent (E)-4-hydroxy-3-methylbut-2-enyl-diphosphate synthase [Anaerovoracaceae bacterium]|jgi:(E)-4-hydroxy-3-methylbut-2-enyl-diphosphate synthase
MRRKTKQVICGDVAIGGNAPITIQSMTNTDTRNIKDTVEQIAKLKEAGCEIIRCAVPDMEAATALGEIKKAIDMPLVADIHFDHRLALAAISNGVDKVRINPGNIGSTDRIQAILNAAKEREIPIRVGVNSGSLEKEVLIKYKGVTAEALAESVLKTVKQIENMGFNNLVVSLKSSDVKLNYDAHQIVSKKLTYPLHIGITESGTITGGKIKSAIGIGSLFLAGIGDTMRVSLTGDPVEEVVFAKEILKAVGIKKSGINFISCPTCGRTQVDLIKITKEIEKRIKPIETLREKTGKKPITVAVMGCEVNGPGEAKEADLGVACGKEKGILFSKGKIIQTYPSSEIPDILIEWIQKME